jgi:hypothetical protein
VVLTKRNEANMFARQRKLGSQSRVRFVLFAQQLHVDF